MNRWFSNRHYAKKMSFSYCTDNAPLAECLRHKKLENTFSSFEVAIWFYILVFVEFYRISRRCVLCSLMVWLETSYHEAKLPYTEIHYVCLRRDNDVFTPPKKRYLTKLMVFGYFACKVWICGYARLAYALPKINWHIV